MSKARFNPPPGWPTPPLGWTPPTGWKPDPSWPEPPAGWQLWLPEAPDVDEAPEPAEADAPSRAPRHAADDPPVAPALQPGAPAAPDEVEQLRRRVRELEAALADSRSATSPGVVLSDQQALQDVGIYRYHHPLENADAYRERLAALNQQIDATIATGQAVLATDMFTMDGSLAKGRKMVADLSKLMLRAYNAEADNCVRSLRSGNVTTASRRLSAAVAAIEKLGQMMEMRINPAYHQLRLEELELTADFQMKVQEERERAREEREQLREQRRAEQELAAEKERLDKERAHYESVLAVLRAKGDETAAAEMSERLAGIDRAIADNDYRIANIRAGYVYVISNIGAFGPGVVKIGMTRRLEPMERVHELGDASVPFRFDVHVLHFSDDAIGLERDLHQAFADRRLNRVNERREFFFATPAEVREILAARTGDLLEFTEDPTAEEYYQSKGSWPTARP